MTTLAARLAGADHLDRLRARAEVQRESVVAVVDELLRLPGANAPAEAARLVERFALRERLMELRALLRRHKRPVRVLKAVCSCLGELGEPADAEALAALLQHDNTMLRRAAVEAVGRLGVSGPLCGALKDEAWEVRMYAAIGLGASDVHPEQGHEHLREAVETETHPATAEQMVRSIADLGAARAAADLSTWLLDGTRHPQVRRACARGLGELGVGTPALTRALMDPDCQVSEQAQWALARLEGA